MNRVILVMILAVCLAGYFIAVRNDQENKKKASVWYKEKVQVVMTNRDIAAGAIITEKMLDLKEVERWTIKNEKDVTRWKSAMIGRVAVRKLYPKEYLTWSNTAERNENLGLGYAIPEGKRAVSLSILPRNMHSGLIKPDDRVDVLVVMGAKTLANQLYKESFVAAQDVQVLAIAQDMKKDLTSTKANVKYDPNNDPGLMSSDKPWTITIATDFAEAERILTAADNGELHLVMRGREDRAKVDAGAYHQETYNDYMQDKIMVIKGSAPEVVIKTY